MQYYLFDQEMQPVIPALLPLNIRGVRFGEGFFETMCYTGMKVRLGNLHFKRLTNSAAASGIKLPAAFNQDWLEAHLQRSVDNRNDWRVRMTIYNAGIDFTGNSSPAYIVLEVQTYKEPKREIQVSVLKHMQPAQYRLQSHKSLNYQFYTTAIQEAISKGTDDVLLMNDQYQLSESSVANLFVVRNQQLMTPPLTTGCIAGVMREYILKTMNVTEAHIHLADLDQCEEIFLTNALGIRSVKEWNGRMLKFSVAEEIRSNMRKLKMES